MRFSLGALTVALAGSAVAHQPVKRAQSDDEPALIQAKDNSLIVPNRFIVEFESGANREQAVRSLDSRRGYTVKKVFEHDGIFSGASVELSHHDDDAMGILSSDVNIARVWPLRKTKMTDVVQSQNYSSIIEAVDYNIHGMTGVQKAHDAGIMGEGATIAVIDTGIDYTHPDLGGGLGPDYAVVSGVDLVGDGCWPNPGCPIVPDEDPMDYHGHGTHVAGIIAGNNGWFTGVAPKAKLMAFKVFTEAGYVTDDILIESFLAATAAGVDIITCSIGGIDGWQDGPWAVVADRMVEEGVLIAIAAGNYGTFGPFMFSSGAAGRNVLAVASTDAELVAELALEVSIAENGATNTSRMAYTPWRGIPWVSSMKDVPVVHVGPACDLPEDADLADKIVLVEKGFCSPPQKENNILAAGGTTVFLFTPVDPDDVGWYIGDFVQLKGASLLDKDGQALAAAIGDGLDITVSVPDEQVIIGVPNSGPNTPSDFTSYGGTFDHAVKPDIAAPGGAILSLYLNHGYASMSGTSMATPYVAGVAALYIGKFGGRAENGKGFAKELSARIMSSGSVLPWDTVEGTADESGIKAPVSQVGTGLVNCTRVLNAQTQLSFTKFALNDTHHFSRYQKLDITNNGPEPVTYTFEVEPAGGYEALQFIEEYPMISSRSTVAQNPLEIVPEVRMPAGTHTLDPKETKRVEFIFKIPEGMNYTNMPVYSGCILVKGSDGGELSVPYVGSGGNTGKETRNEMFLRALGYPKLFSGYDVTYEEKHSFTFNLSVTAQDFPKFSYAVNYGTPELRWDIFEEGWREHEWKYPPVVGEDGYVGSVASWVGSETSGLGDVFDPDYDSEDDVVPFPFTKLPRNVVFSRWWLGRLANGSDIAPGKYNMRIAALAPFGNREASDNWDRLDTPMLEVLAD